MGTPNTIKYSGISKEAWLFPNLKSDGDLVRKFPQPLYCKLSQTSVIHIVHIYINEDRGIVFKSVSEENHAKTLAKSPSYVVFDVLVFVQMIEKFDRPAGQNSTAVAQEGLPRVVVLNVNSIQIFILEDYLTEGAFKRLPWCGRLLFNFWHFSGI